MTTILMVTDASYPISIGGAHRIVSSLASELAGSHEVVVLTSGRPLGCREILDNVTYVYYGTVPAHGLVSKFLFFALRPFFAFRTLPKTKFDVLWINWGLCAVLLSPLFRHGLVVYDFHGPAGAEYREELPPVVGRIAKTLFSLVERVVLRSADHIVVHSRYMLEELKRIHGTDRRGKYHIIPPGVDQHIFGSPRPPIPPAYVSDLPQGAAVILCVRRLVKRTGVDLAIRALAELELVSPLAPIMLVVGSGPERPALEGLARELGLDRRVIFVGRISDAELATCYERADVVVVPSVALEGFGMSTLEAMTSGRPVVATNVGANPELVGQLGARVVADPTPQAVAASLQFALVNRAELGDLARTVASKYSFQLTANKVEALLDENSLLQ